MSRHDVRRAVFVLVMLAGSPSAGLAIDINVNATVQGGSVQIGTINAQSGPMDDTDHLTARFDFDPEYAFLDEWYDFQWINVVTRIVGDPSPLFPLGAPSFDPIPMNDDDAPYYYNNEEWSSGMFGMEDIRDDGIFSLFSDSPQRAAGNGFDFTTYLVVNSVTDPLIPSQAICPLAAFTWEYRGTGDASTVGMETAVVFMQLDAALTNVNEMTGFYGKFYFMEDCDLTACPSPTGAMLLALGGLVAMRRRR